MWIKSCIMWKSIMETIKNILKLKKKEIQLKKDYLKNKQYSNELNFYDLSMYYNEEDLKNNINKIIKNRRKNNGKDN